MCSDSTMTFFSLYSCLTFSHFTQLYSKFPNMDLVLVVNVEKPPVATISPGGIAASIPGQIAVYARDNGTQHYAFTLGLVRACVCVCLCVCMCVCVCQSVCVCVYVYMCATYMCVSVSVCTPVCLPLLLCLVSWCVPTHHTTPHYLSSCTELTLFLVYNTTSMYCPDLWCTAQHALCPNVPLPLHLAPLLPVHSHGSLSCTDDSH